MIGSDSKDTMSYTPLKNPASAKVLENEKINIGIKASPSPQPTQRIALVHAMMRTP